MVAHAVHPARQAHAIADVGSAQRAAGVRAVAVERRAALRRLRRTFRLRVGHRAARSRAAICDEVRGKSACTSGDVKHESAFRPPRCPGRAAPSAAGKRFAWRAPRARRGMTIAEAEAALACRHIFDAVCARQSACTRGDVKDRGRPPGHPRPCRRHALQHDPADASPPGASSTPNLSRRWQQSHLLAPERVLVFGSLRALKARG